LKKVIVALCIFILLTSSIAACEGEQLAHFFGIAVDRCQRRDITLSFDVEGKRKFITLEQKEGKKLYEALKEEFEP
jgi:hypothetical protein